MNVSIFQTAKRLGISRTRVYQFVKKGDLIVNHDASGRVWVDSDSLEALIERRTGSDDGKVDRLALDAQKTQAAYDRDAKERERRKLEQAEFQRKVWADEDALKFRMAVIAELRETRKALTDIGTTLTVLTAAMAAKLGVDLIKKG